MMADSSAARAWLDLVGALHPALVHFPLALVIVATIVEAARIIGRREGVSSFAVTAVRFGAVFAVCAAVSGWFDAEATGAADTVGLFFHRWVGIAVAGMLLALALASCLATRDGSGAARRWWRSGLVACAVGATVTGSLGGDMVHGEGHITQALWRAIDATERGQRREAEAAARAQLGLPAAEPSPSAVDASPPAATAGLAPTITLPGAIEYATAVAPILEANCYECHGGGKKKGGVRLDDVARMTSERDGEFVVKPGAPDESLLIRFASLPADSEDRMPPKGEMLTSAQLAVIAQWIREGANGGSTAPAVAAETPKWSLPERRLSEGELAAIDTSVAALARDGIDVRKIARESAYYGVDASRASPPPTNATLELVAVIAPHVVDLNAARAAVTDDCGRVLGKLVELRDLRLDFTRVGDQVAAVAAKLPHLESANFVGTELTDAGLGALVASKTIRRLHVWSSRVTAEAVDRLRAAHPQIRIDDGR